MNVYKIEGAKNSFVLVSFLDSNLNVANIYEDKAKLAHKAKALCNDPRIRVDGCIFVFPHTTLDFAWEFFNSDGSDALMCGNAARAVALWFYENVNSKTKIEFFTPAQAVVAEVLGSTTNSKDYLARGQVKVWLNETQFVSKDHNYSIYNSGVPHLCVYLGADKSLSGDFEDLGQRFFKQAQNLRFPKVLDAKGANVTYLWADSKEAFESSDIKAMSFERGVENWTQACGTGAMAAAYFAHKELDMKFPINVQMPGGVLEINQGLGKTILTGPAEIQSVLDFKELIF
jgi:diaminopimelate epimerase